MLVKKQADLTYADITPKTLYMGRRNFLLGLGVAGAAVKLYKKLPTVFAGPATGSVPVPLSGLTKSKYTTTGEKITPMEDVTHYNNYYEFGTDKEDPSKNAGNFVTSPWSVSVEGEVEKPRKFTMDEILKLAPLEERIYRHRCVEAWSMVIPWQGIPLAEMIKRFEPAPSAKYVAFTTVLRPSEMPGQRRPILQWPYVEGLRMDEAMNDLTLLATGLYGKPLPNQDGAPIRLIVPWKYGFKGIKSIVKISLVADQPPTTWSSEGPSEYGFYANVNPTVDHPRWSQATELRIGDSSRRPTLMFNGYAEQVGAMYAGMDLHKFY
jgi:sulfoxide reductase catalytic subunit YedY